MRLLPTFLVCLCSVLFAGSAFAELETVAGTGEAGYSGDGGRAVDAKINNPFGVIVGPDGDIFFCDTGNHAIRRVSRITGTITTIAGTGEKGYAGDGGPPEAALLYEPYELRFHPGGDLYWVEMQNHLVRRLDARSHTVHTVAGTGEVGFSGDGGPATEATFNRPHSIEFDASGENLFICDIGNHRIRRLELATGLITTWCGDGKKQPTPDGAAVSPDTPLNGPRALARDPEGNFWLALREGNAVYRIDLSEGTLEHVAGTGKKGFTGNGGPAAEATLSGPKGVAISPDGSLIYLADTESHSVRAIDLNDSPPSLRLIAGDGKRGTFARLHGVGVDPVTGDLYIGDSENHVVTRIRAADLPESAGATAPVLDDFEVDAFELEGIACKLLRPVEAAEGRPWIWRCRFFGAFPQADAALAARGWHVAWTDVSHLFGGPEAMRRFEKLYAHLTTTCQLAPRAVMEGFSRGGLPAVYWTAAHPDRVCGLYLDAPVVDIRSWPSQRAEALWQTCLTAHGLTDGTLDTWRSPVDALQASPEARALPMMIVCGGNDAVVPFSENAALIEACLSDSSNAERDLTVIIKAAGEHHPHSLHEPSAIVEFAERAFGAAQR